MLLGTYGLRTPRVEASDDANGVLTNDGELQPDCLLFRAAPGGRAVRRTEEGYLEGAPELVVEVAASSAHMT